MQPDLIDEPKLNYSLSKTCTQVPSVLPFPKTSGQLLRKGAFQEDALERFCNQDSDNCLTDLIETVSPSTFQFSRFSNLAD